MASVANACRGGGCLKMKSKWSSSVGSSALSACGTLAAFAFEVEFADAPNGAGAEGILLYWGAIKSGWGRYIWCKKNAVCFGMFVTH